MIWKEAVLAYFKWCCYFYIAVFKDLYFLSSFRPRSMDFICLTLYVSNNFKWHVSIEPLHFLHFIPVDKDASRRAEAPVYS
jgi:hypothetical protein